MRAVYETPTLDGRRANACDMLLVDRWRGSCDSLSRR